MIRKTKYPKCAYCSTTDAVIRYGKRLKTIRYFCKHCNKTFSKIYTNNTFSPQAIFNQYMDGTPIRKIATQYKVSPMTIFRHCKEVLTKLPSNLDITCAY